MPGHFEFPSRFRLFCFRNPSSYLQLAKIIPDSQCTLKTCTKCVVFAFSFLWLIWLFMRLLIIYKTMEQYFWIIHSSYLNWIESNFFSPFTYCICGCWCWCDCVHFTWRRRSSWLWARRKARLAHWFLTHFTNFQLQTLLIWKYIAMLHLTKRRQLSNHEWTFPIYLSFNFLYLKFGCVFWARKHARIIEQFHNELATLFQCFSMAFFGSHILWCPWCWIGATRTTNWLYWSSRCVRWTIRFICVQV